jgi:hypothetical protein
MTLTKDIILQKLGKKNWQLEPIGQKSGKYELGRVLSRGAGEVTIKTSGVAPRINGEIPQEYKGQVGTGPDNLSIERAQNGATQCALVTLWIIDQMCEGDWSRVLGMVDILGAVNANPYFTDHPKVLDGASDVFHIAMGSEMGAHTRMAYGASSLPHNVVVEIAASFRMKTR